MSVRCPATCGLCNAAAVTSCCTKSGQFLPHGTSCVLPSRGNGGEGGYCSEGACIVPNSCSPSFLPDAGDGPNYNFEFDGICDLIDNSCKVKCQTKDGCIGFPDDFLVDDWPISHLDDGTRCIDQEGRWSTCKAGECTIFVLPGFDDQTLQGAVDEWIADEQDALRKYGAPIAEWDTSRMTTLAALFKDAATFNAPIGRWNTAKVVDFSYMFYGAASFDSDISDWDTSAAEDFSYMFYSYQDIDSNVFRGHGSGGPPSDGPPSTFNQPLDRWVTSNVKTTAFMFYAVLSFVQELPSWDMSNNEDMTAMFKLAGNDDARFVRQSLARTGSGDERDWLSRQSGCGTDYSSLVGNQGCHHPEDVVDTIDGVYYKAGRYDKPGPSDGGRESNYIYGPHKDWDTSKVKSMASLFESARLKQVVDVSNWDVSNVEVFDNAFDGLRITPLQVCMHNTEPGLPPTKEAEAYCTQPFSEYLPLQAYWLDVTPNVDLSNWNTGKAVSFKAMFARRRYDGVRPLGIGNFDMSSAVSIDGMFADCGQNVDYDLGFVFGDVAATGNDLGKWNTGNLERMQHVFAFSSGAIHSIADWDVSSVKSFASFAEGWAGFMDLSKWQTTSMEISTYMFNRIPDVGTTPYLPQELYVTQGGVAQYRMRPAIVAGLPSWNTERLVSASYMFQGCESCDDRETYISFNGVDHFFDLDLRLWNTESLEGAASMFKDCTHLVSCIDCFWDASSIVYMQEMFSGAVKYEGDYNNENTKWSVNPYVVNTNRMYFATKLSTAPEWKLDWCTFQNGCRVCENQKRKPTTPPAFASGP